MDVKVSLLLVLYSAVLSLAAEEEATNATSVRDEQNRTPLLQFFLDTLLTPPNRNPEPAPAVKATKTEYIEVTRRHTIHPVCYTMYEKKAPCLPHRSLDDDPIADFDVDHRINAEERAATEDASEDVKPVAEVLEGGRRGRYLEFVPRPQEITLEGSESQPLAPTTPYRRPEAVTSTKTILLTKIERYTDHRVTATMVALNCRPVDPAIPRCRPGGPPPARPKIENEGDRAAEAAKKVTETVKGQTPEPTKAKKTRKTVQVSGKPSRRIIFRL